LQVVVSDSAGKKCPLLVCGRHCRRSSQNIHGHALKRYILSNTRILSKSVLSDQSTYTHSLTVCCKSHSGGFGGRYLFVSRHSANQGQSDSVSPPESSIAELAERQICMPAQGSPRLLKGCSKLQGPRYELTLEGVSLSARLQRHLTARMRRKCATMLSEYSTNYIVRKLLLLQVAIPVMRFLGRIWRPRVWLWDAAKPLNYALLPNAANELALSSYVQQLFHVVNSENLVWGLLSQVLKIARLQSPSSMAPKPFLFLAF